MADRGYQIVIKTEPIGKFRSLVGWDRIYPTRDAAMEAAKRADRIFMAVKVLRTAYGR